MHVGWMIASLVVARLVMQPAAAVPLAVDTAPAPPPPALVLVQSGDAPGERLQRLWQHRSIIENALAPRHVEPAQPPAPQSRALQPPADIEPPEAEPREAEPPEVASAGEAGNVDCRAAAAVVADYGFSAVRPTDCAGDLYTFSARRDGTGYAISVTPDGEIAEVSRQ